MSTTNKNVSSPSRGAVYLGWTPRILLEWQPLRGTDGPSALTTGALGHGADPGLQAFLLCSICRLPALLSLGLSWEATVGVLGLPVLC